MYLLDDNKRELTRHEKWVRRVIKSLALLILLFFVGVVILSRIGGDSEALKKGLEGFLANSTGMTAEVGTFHGLTFFPAITTFAEDIVIHPPRERPAITIGSLKFSRAFWDTFFSRPVLEDIQLEEFSLGEGYLTPRAFIDGNLTVSPDGFDGKPAMTLTGKYGDAPVTFNLALAYDAQRMRPRYTLVADAPFSLSIGPLKAEGFAGRGHLGGLQLKFTNLLIDGHKELAALQPLGGTLTLLRSAKGMTITLALKSKSSDVTIILRKDPQHADKIDLDFAALDLADLPHVTALINILTDIYYKDRKGIYLPPAAMTLVVDKMLVRGTPVGAVGMAGTVNADRVFESTDLKGTFADGTLSGTISMDGHDPNDTKLTLDLKLSHWNYAALQAVSGGPGHISGSADSFAKLTGTGGSWKAVRGSLNGEITTLGGKGRMASGALNLWGDGLLNKMLPSMGSSDPLAVNCLMMRFDVKKGLATAAPVFMDTENLTVTGEGTVNLANGRLDMLFDSDSKGIAVGKIGPAVRVTGNWVDPDVSPDTISLGKKLGGLILGTVNPAFWALSLTDMGLGDDHPCAAYIGKKK